MTLATFKQYVIDGKSRYAVPASKYLSDFAACLAGDGGCPVKLFDLQSADAWTKALEVAKTTLTFHDPASEILTKSFSDGAEIRTGAIMEYEAILSASGKDRDGDILHPEGMRIDTKLPDLWQHIQASPTGALVEIKEQNADRLVCKFAIADTHLGRDTAALMRVGALRKSHGFMPGVNDVVEALGFQKNANGQDVPTGFRVKGCDVFEASNVSIPAHPGAEVIALYEKEFDGVCTLFGQKEFEFDAVNRWAKSVYDARPVQGKGFTAEPESSEATTPQGDESGDLKIVKGGVSVTVTRGGNITVSADNESMKPDVVDSGLNSGEDKKPAKAKPKGTESLGKDEVTKSVGDALETKAAGCGCGKKDAATPLAIKAFDADSLTTKSYGGGMPDYLPGSFEEIQRKARKAAEKSLEDGGDYDDDNGWLSIIGTYSDRVVVCCHKWSRSAGDKCKCYSVPLSVGTDGEVTGGKDYSEVEVQATVVEKSRNDSLGLFTKTWRPELNEEIQISKIFATAKASEIAKALVAKAIGGDAEALPAIEQAASVVRGIETDSEQISALDL
ncbi:HK97 family phage prohead protease [Kordiimonas sp.]|uniref:HK97 family phage prohead protease n=1 Tax=Kordiimonas sp. TaxID=1970157 RepID=UPI003A8FCFDA